MKAISLWQPWSSLISHGHKTIETRSWTIAYRGPILIHAAQRRMVPLAVDLHCKEVAAGRLPRNLPYGAIVCVATLADIKAAGELRQIISPQELSYGDYSVGRFGWILEDIRPFRDPIEYRGAQGLFDVPLEVVSKAIDLARAA